MTSKRLAGVTFDLTGTLLGYRGRLGHLYCAGARRAGEACPEMEAVERAWPHAYRMMSAAHPHFGYDEGMSDRAWWREVVRQSFAAAGVSYVPEWRFERVYARIYQSFGSRRAYRAFPDAHRLLKRLRDLSESHGLVVGAVSNASSRYRDGILPMLNLDLGLDFVLLSGLVGISKPDPRLFRMAAHAVEATANGWEVCETSYVGAAEVCAARGGGWPHDVATKPVQVGDILHVGDSLLNDCVPATELGMRAALIDRFDSRDGAEARKRGFHVFRDLNALGQFLNAQGWLPHAATDERSAGREAEAHASAASAAPRAQHTCLDT